MTTARITLIGKPGCHLCDVAREVIVEVCAATGESFTERSLFDDPELFDRYGEWIPVVLVDDVKVAHWSIDPRTLRRALA